MSRARDYRRTKDGRSEYRFAGRKRRYQPLLRALGLEEAFGRLPRPFQEALWAAKFPDPVVDYAEGVPQAARRALERRMLETTTVIEDAQGGKTAIPSRDFPTVLYGLRLCVMGTRHAGMPPAMIEFLTKAGPALNATYDRHFIQGYADLGRHAEAALVDHSRMDTRQLALRLEHVALDNLKSQLVYKVSCDTPERVRATIDGEPRPAYRVGQSRAPNGIKWVSWPVREMGLGDEETLPVYVQSHALRHLRERMDCVPQHAPWMDYHLAESLEQPAIAQRQKGGDVLVEFRVQGYKTGYLVVSRAGGAMVVRTFLLLTMTGTPEGDRLYRKIRLTRDEAAWLSLHRLSSFTHTDLRNDAELLEILDSCGCKQLLELRLDSDLSPLREGYAASLRRFLNMAPPADAGLAGDDGDTAPIRDAA